MIIGQPERLRAGIASGAAGRMLLSALAPLFGVVTRVRNELYNRKVLPSFTSALPVISIGNITAGGNAKTPTTVYLASLLKQEGYQPVVLSRGYGGSITGPHLVSDADSVELVGDEPWMIHRLFSLPVVVGSDRRDSARLVEKKGVGNVILLDDGFQHRRLARQLDIVCINLSDEDAIREFREGQLLPMGEFREQREAALDRADIVVCTTRQPGRELVEQALNQIRDLFPAHVGLFTGEVVPECVYRIATGEEIAPQEVHVFSGIANPRGFYRTLERAGFKIAGRCEFADHHHFDRSDLEKLKHASQGKPLVCTEKDAIKIPSEAASGICALRIHTEISDQKLFLQEVLKACRNLS